MKKIQDHFKKPKGMIGRLVGKQMALENKTLNEWTVRQLDIYPESNVLEIGYGPGYALDFILNHYENVHVDGIDISGTMKEEASHRLEPGAESDGEVGLFVGDIAETPIREQYYDIVFSVNNYTLWENRYDGLRHIYSGLVSQGKIAITVQPRQEDVKTDQENRFAREIVNDLEETGFTKIVVQYKRLSPKTAVCVTAFKP